MSKGFYKYSRVAVLSKQVTRFRCSTNDLSDLQNDGDNKTTFDGYKGAIDSKKVGYQTAKELQSVMPCIILVDPFLDQNVGSCARAMLNFGLTELRVVSPRCDIKSPSARALAAGAVDILEDAKVYPTLKDCIADLNRVMATTVRPRDMSQVIYTPVAAAKNIFEEKMKVGIMFGRESSGLKNEEIAMADSIITIQSFPQFSSINLAQAVNIVCYEIWSRYLEINGASPPEEWLQPKLTGSKIATREYVDIFLNRLEKALDDRGHMLDPRRRELHYMDVRNIFQRVRSIICYSL